MYIHEFNEEIVAIMLSDGRWYQSSHVSQRHDGRISFSTAGLNDAATRVVVWPAKVLAVAYQSVPVPVV